MPKSDNIYLMAVISAYKNGEQCAEYNCINCKAPCCKLHVGVTENEITNGYYLLKKAQPQDKNLDPYDILSRKEDGSCVYQNEDGSCGIYTRRPWVCRTYTCEKDTRIDDKARFETGTPNIDTLFPEEKKASSDDETK